MKKLLLLNALLIPLAGIFWSCSKHETPTVSEENSMLKNGTICETYANSREIPLLAGQNIQVGKIIVSNNNEFLSIQFVADEPFTISEEHLWVGTCKDDVPSNKQNIPIPGQFSYTNKDCFMISLEDIAEDPVMLLGGEDNIYIFAHAAVINNESGEEESAWSAGETFGTKRWGTYSVYKCNPVGGGCFPYVAECGNKIDGTFYYDNKKGGSQIIHVSNGEVAGTVEYKSGNIYFRFTQDWMFTTLVYPPIKIKGLYEPEVSQTDFDSLEPTFSYTEFCYYIPVSYYPYYVLQLNIQYCY